MSLLVTLNGANYIIPQTNEVGWGSNLDDYFVAIAAGVLQKTGGSFTLSAETDFGASFGLKSLYYKSRTANIAGTGILRLANNSDAVSWRNAGNSADLALTVNASNQLCFNGTPIESNALTSAHILVGNSSNVATDVAMSGNIGIDNTGATTIQAGVIVNSMVNASAAIAYSKLNLTGSIVNADVSGSAAIAYSKLALTNSIVNADINSAAAIAYSKLTLTGSIVNADINASAAIAYSKLALTGSIVNADINASAAIAYSKLNLALSIVNADVSTSAAIAYSKLNLTGSIVNADVNASAAISYSKLALTGSIVNADVSSSAAIAITKVAIGTANQIIGTNNGATANEFKTLTATANQVSVTHGAGTVTFATPQDIGTASAVRFGSLTLGGALDASSILSLTSTSKGFLPPVMTTTQKNAITSPTDGLIVYDSSLAQLFLRSASAWTPLSVGGGSGTVGSGTQYQLGYYAAGGTTISGLTLITGSRALASDANGLPVAATTTATELGYVNGVTSAIQTQINTKAPTASPTFTGVAAFAAGSASAPSITTSTTTGLYSGGTNILGFATNGVQRLALDASGNMLLGPGATNSAAIGDLRFTTDSGGVRYASVQGFRGGDAATIDLRFFTINGDGGGVLERARIMPAGNILVNTTALAGYASVNPILEARQTSILNTNAGDGTIALYGTTAFAQDLGAAVVMGQVYSSGGAIATGARIRSGKENATDGNYGSYIALDARVSGAGLSQVLKISPTTGLATLSASLQFNATSTQGIVGTTTNDSAAAGNVGEVITATATGVNMTAAGNYVDVTSISLTAGDWLISGLGRWFCNGTTCTQIQIGISTTAGNSMPDQDFALNTWGLNAETVNGWTGGKAISCSVSDYHVKLSGTTTYYWKARSGAYTGTAPQFDGRISATRIR